MPNLFRPDSSRTRYFLPIFPLNLSRIHFRSISKRIGGVVGCNDKKEWKIIAPDNLRHFFLIKAGITNHTQLDNTVLMRTSLVSEKRSHKQTRRKGHQNGQNSIQKAAVKGEL